MATPRVDAFELTGADGLPIRGNVHTAAKPGEERPAVVICHGFKGFKDWGFFPYIADRLAAAGFTAVRFNFSGAGVSDGDHFDQPERFGHDTYSRQLADLRTVTDWTGADRLGLFGHSRGGGVAVLQAGDDARVATLVTWASVAEAGRWDRATIEQWRRDGKIEIKNVRTGEILPLYTDVLDDIEQYGETMLNIERAAARIAAPWLIVHGTADESVPVDSARRLASWTRPETGKLELIDGGGHTFGARHPWTGANPQLEDALDTTVRWFGRYLL